MPRLVIPTYVDCENVYQHHMCVFVLTVNDSFDEAPSPLWSDASPIRRVKLLPRPELISTLFYSYLLQ